MTNFWKSIGGIALVLAAIWIMVMVCLTITPNASPKTVANAVVLIVGSAIAIVYGVYLVLQLGVDTE